MGSGVRVGMVNRGPVFTGSFHSGVRFGSGFRGQFFFNRRFHHRTFLFVGIPWWSYGYPGYYYPDYSYAADMYGLYDPSRANQLSRDLPAEIDRLSDEIERLREDQQGRYGVPQAPPNVAPPPAEKSESNEPTVLVFKDKHTRQVHNFAIVGQTLWIFTEQRAHKVPLSSLDVEATRKTNEERGVEFRLPKT